MRLILPFAISLCSSLPAFSQNFVGQWKGAFVDKSVTYGDWGGDKCDYVIELESFKDNKVTGYSYTYFTENGKKYYTICKLEGRLDPRQKTLEITETGRTKTNVPSNIRNCFQLHRLTYSKKGDEEVLTGDWVPAPNQESDCGYGKTSLVRRSLDNSSVASNSNMFKPANKSKEKSSNTALTAANSMNTSASVNKKNNRNAVTESVPVGKVEADQKVLTAEVNEMPTAGPLSNPDKAPATNGFGKRSANVIRTIEIEKKTFRIDIFDNGEIDGDSISLFFNGELIVSNKKLTEKPITLFLSLKDELDANDLEMYAENLGTIPPNTAVMTVTDGSKRYDLRVTSDLRKNGVIRFTQQK